jgi:hypothetical protein
LLKSQSSKLFEHDRTTTNKISGPLITRHEYPATHFFATCVWGVQYPKKSFATKPLKDFYYARENGPNEHCDALMEWARDNKFKEGQGSWAFCKNSTLADKVMKAEVEWPGRLLYPVEGDPWSGHNHRWRCNHFLKEHEKEFKNVKSPEDIDW